MASHFDLLLFLFGFIVIVCTLCEVYILSRGQYTAMKQEIHPTYEAITVTCACGNSFETRSTMGDDLSIEICSECHPFFTGKQKLVDTAGRVDRFNKRFARRKGAETVKAEK